MNVAPPFRRPLGQLALEAGLITNEQLASAIADIPSTGKKLGEVLIARRGLLDEAQLAQLLELQHGDEPAPRLGEAGHDPEEGEGEPDSDAPAAPKPRRRSRGESQEAPLPASDGPPQQVPAAASDPAPAVPEAAAVPPEPAPAREPGEALLAAIRRDMVDLVVEVEQRTGAAAEDAARVAQLEGSVVVAREALREREQELLALRTEVAESRTALGAQLARQAELQEQLGEARAAAQAQQRDAAAAREVAEQLRQARAEAQARDRELLAARQEVQRLTHLLEQHAAQERAVRTALEQLARGLADGTLRGAAVQQSPNA